MTRLVDNPAAVAAVGPAKSVNGKPAQDKEIIPGSRRADGTMRKEIRVKPGYKPPEEVEVYKNRTAESWKKRSEGPVPGSESAATTTTDAVGNATAAAANKNAKRREARKKAAAAAATEGGSDSAANALPTPTNTVDYADSTESADVKEARKLAKKLRQARELKDKKEQGASLLPEQFAKVIKIKELIRQLDTLGFDADGDKKNSPVLSSVDGNQ